MASYVKFLAILLGMLAALASGKVALSSVSDLQFILAVLLAQLGIQCAIFVRLTPTVEVEKSDRHASRPAHVGGLRRLSRLQRQEAIEAD